MPHDRTLKAMNAAHRLLLAVTGGRFGWDLVGMPVLELTTAGRRSGSSRSVMLTSPLREGSTYVVVGSRGGDDRHPAWFLNLREHPDIEVSLRGGPPRRVTARIATPEERAGLWPRVVARHPRYAAYQERTEREIPLVLLGPLG